MCGIFGIINYKNNDDCHNHNKIKHRGPDNNISILSSDYFFSFHRLSINDLSEKGNQPFETDDYIIMCNGEIYNYKQLIMKYNLVCDSTSDCEVIAKLYEKIGIKDIVEIIDGVFAISIYNKKTKELYLIRDPIGVRPIYYTINDNEMSFSSEGKALKGSDIKQLEPGSYLYYDNKEYKINKYYSLPNISINTDFDLIKFQIKLKLLDSVNKRMISDRPIGCLLSGGLDSSLIASILMQLSDYPIKTFSVGFNDSEDLKYAKKVADYIGSDHYELILDYNEILPQIPDVIKTLETYDVTTIRASIGMYFLSKYISENHKERVIFSGEGSDELFCGYLYFHKTKNNKFIEDESKRLVSDLYKYDVLRADRCTAAFGLELRVPFLDTTFVNFVLSLSADLRKPIDGIEKYILRKSFENNYIPKDILYRKKEAFSDGVGSMTKPFYKYIQQFLNFVYNELGDIDDDDEVEKICYQDTYYSFYEYKPINYYWMPKWVDVNNPSARVL